MTNASDESMLSLSLILSGMSLQEFRQNSFQNLIVGCSEIMCMCDAESIVDLQIEYYAISIALMT